MKEFSLWIASLAMVTALAISPALAAKGGGGKGGKPSSSGTSSFNVVMQMDVDGDGIISQGDRITFAVSTTATTEPHIQLACTQNGVVVFGAATGMYAGYPWPWTQIMELASSMWQSGGASCQALLQAYEGTRVTTLSTLNFNVAP